MEYPEALRDAIDQGEESMHRVLNASVLRVLEELGTYTRLTPVSSESFEGLDDVYTFVQSAFAGAEDLATR
jgi:hypothetical protein